MDDLISSPPRWRYHLFWRCRKVKSAICMLYSASISNSLSNSVCTSTLTSASRALVYHSMIEDLRLTCLRWILFSLHPLVTRSETCNSCKMICLIIFKAHTNILIIIKVKILVLIRWPYMSPKSCWLWSLEWLAHSENLVQFFSKKNCVFWVPVLTSPPDHIPLKYRCADYCCVQFRHAYLNEPVQELLASQRH